MDSSFGDALARDMAKALFLWVLFLILLGVGVAFFGMWVWHHLHIVIWWRVK